MFRASAQLNNLVYHVAHARKMRQKLPTPALANLTIALLLLALAALGLKILNRISTHPELISTSLGLII